MQVFVYPRDYLNQRGNVKHCWEVHVKKMKEHGLPYVDYFSFYNRLKRYNRDLYRAIHTPLDYTYMGLKDRIIIKARTLRYRFIYLFKQNDGGRKRSKGHGYAC